MGVCSHVGRRVISRFRLAGPTRAVRRGGSDVGGSEDGVVFDNIGAEVSAEGEEVMNSLKEGPTLRRSRKVVVGRRGGGLGDGASVANERVSGRRTKGKEVDVEEYRQRSRGTFAAIAAAT